MIRQKTRERYFGERCGLITVITHSSISVQLSVTFCHHSLPVRESLESTVSSALVLVVSRGCSGGSVSSWGKKEEFDNKIEKVDFKCLKTIFKWLKYCISFLIAEVDDSCWLL